MIMKNVIIIMLMVVLGLIFSLSEIFAQNYECGTVSTPKIAQEVLSRRQSTKNLGANLKLTVQDVAVQIHIVGDENGNGQLTTDLGYIKNKLNTAFENVGFQFVFCPTNYINDTQYHNISTRNTEEEGEMASRYNRINAVNVYFLSNIHTSYAPFPGGNNWIIIKNSHAENISTLAHEMGHHFDLLHTHENQNGSEAVSRNFGYQCYNCDFAGDGFCDTPADPNPELLPVNPNNNKHYKLSHYVNDCSISEGDIPIKDWCYTDTDYLPDPKNIMSYSDKPCRDKFSTEQIEVIVATRQPGGARSYLVSDCTNVIFPNCTDEIHNGDEEKTDCGGSCQPCVKYPNIANFDCEAGCNHNLVLQCGAVSAEEYNGSIVISNAQIDNQSSSTAYNVGIEYSLVGGGAEIILTPLFGSASIINEIPAYTMITAPSPIIYTLAGLNGAYQVRVKLVGLGNSCISTEPLYLGNISPPQSVSCFDGIWNQGEAGIDCGGPCPAACPTCYDDIQNQGETGIDCGGPCPPCPQPGCSSNINMNGGNILSHIESNTYIISPSQEGNIATINPSNSATFDASTYISLMPGFTANYGSNFLAVIDGCGGVFKSADSNEEVLLSSFELSEANLDVAITDLSIHPNPFTDQSVIQFSQLVTNTPVTVFVTDMMGNKVVSLVDNEQMSIGTHQLIFDGNNLPAGMYYCTLMSGDMIQTKKMMIIK